VPQNKPGATPHHSKRDAAGDLAATAELAPVTAELASATSKSPNTFPTAMQAARQLVAGELASNVRTQTGPECRTRCPRLRPAWTAGSCTKRALKPARARRSQHLPCRCNAMAIVVTTPCPRRAHTCRKMINVTTSSAKWAPGFCKMPAHRQANKTGGPALASRTSGPSRKAADPAMTAAASRRKGLGEGGKGAGGRSHIGHMMACFMDLKREQGSSKCKTHWPVTLSLLSPG
jgi:hypothetical protein